MAISIFSLIKGITLVLVAAAGWRLYKLFNTSTDKLIERWGITGDYLPDIIIFVSILILILVLYFIGSKISPLNAIKRILKIK